jgi:hypothetical protein
MKTKRNGNKNIDFSKFPSGFRRCTTSQCSGTGEIWIIVTMLIGLGSRSGKPFRTNGSRLLLLLLLIRGRGWSHGRTQVTIRRTITTDRSGHGIPTVGSSQWGSAHRSSFIRIIVRGGTSRRRWIIGTNGIH